MDYFRWMPRSTVNSPDGTASVIFFEGCNLRCPFCYVGDLVTKGVPGDLNRHSADAICAFISEQVATNTKTGAKFLLSDWIVISGGEPLLDIDNVLRFAAHARKLGFKVKVNTNGSLPYNLRMLIGVVDYIAMDYKVPLDNMAVLGESSPKLPELYKESIGLLSTYWQNACELNTVLTRQLTTSDSIATMARFVSASFGVPPLWNLNRFLVGKDTPSLDPSYSPVNSLLFPTEMATLAQVAKAYYRGEVRLKI